MITMMLVLLGLGIYRRARPRACPVGRIALLGPVLLLILATGCAGLKGFNPLAGGVAEQRKKRDAETAKRFAAHRDIAEFQAAMARWEQQDLRGCREELERFLARNPKHRDARLLMADVLLASQRPDEALDHVKLALAAHPEDADVQYAMGLMLDATGHNAEALAYYERAVRTAPDNEAYQMSCRTARRAADRNKTTPTTPPVADQTKASPVSNNILWMAGEPERPQPKPEISWPLPVEPKLAEAVEDCPSSRANEDGTVPLKASELPSPASSPMAASCEKPPVVAKGTTIHKPSLMCDTAVRPATVTTEINTPAKTAAKSQTSRSPVPSTAPATVAPAAAPAAAAPAGNDGSAGIGENEPAAAELRQGYAALARSGTEEALTHFRAAAKLSPDNPQVLILAATAALRQREPRVAVELLAPATAKFPKSAALHRVLGTAYYRMGDFPASQRALQQALSLDKSNALSYFLMGCTLAKLGQLEGADVHYRQAQALDPRYAVRR